MRLFHLIVSLHLALISARAESLLNNPGYVASLTPPQPPPTNPSPSAFYPTSIVNTAAFWSYRDLPPGPVNAWTDEVSYLVLTNIPVAGLLPPANSGVGVYFYGIGGSGLINSTTFVTSSNFSLWCVVANQYMFQNPQIYGNLDASTGIMFNATAYAPANLIDGHWGADNLWAAHPFGQVIFPQAGVPTETNGPLWNDIVDSQGVIYLNGAATSGNIGKPLGNVTWQSLGANVGDTHNLYGYIKYLLISTNHAITAAEAGQLYSWEQTNGITNVTGSLVGWWKFTNSTLGTSLSDSSGNGLSGTLQGNPEPLWTNGLNSIVSNALSFDGIQNYVIIPFSLASFTNVHQITLSMWIAYTNATESASFMVNNPYPGDEDGFQTFTDVGVPVVRGALGGSGYIESNPIVLDDGNWHHFVWASDGTNIFSWYDGVQDTLGKPSIGFAANTAGWWTGWTSLQISGQNEFTNLQQCVVTDVRIYNRILSSAEVDILYRSPIVDLIQGAYNY